MKIDILKIGLDPLLHFESVARNKSLKKAADELRLSQPAITHSLKKLEGSLGVELCVRSRASFNLTESGKRLFIHCKKIKDEVKSFESFLADDDIFDGSFTIGVIDNFQNSFLDKAIEKIVKEFPRMKLSIQVYAATEIQHLVSIGEVDVGLGIFNRKLDQLIYRKVGEETIGHYISEKHPLWNKKDLNETDVKGHVKTWVDMINRDRLALDSEVYADTGKPSVKIMSYANNLNAAILLLQSGTTIVPFPAEYLQARKLNFKYRALNKIFKPYSLKQELVFRKDFANASRPAMFFLEQLQKVH